MDIVEKEEFLNELNQELKALDFYYEMTDDGRKYDSERAWHKMILSKIESIEDEVFQELAITLYKIHSKNNGGRLEMNWEVFLQK